MLIKCPDCGNMRSSDADACPFCGCKRTPGSGCMGIVALVVVLGLIFLSHSKEAYVVTRKANFREAPNGEILGQISKGTELHCHIENGWCRTTYADKKVYVSLKVLKKRVSASEPQKTGSSSSQNVSTSRTSHSTGLIDAVSK